MTRGMAESAVGKEREDVFGSNRGATSIGGQSAARFAFIVGAARSGTTLLTELLARHPDVHVTPETHFFRLACSSPRMARENIDPSEIGKLAHRLLTTMGFEQNSELEAFLDELAAHPRRRAEVAALAFRHGWRSSAKSLLIEKTPDHALHWKAILCCLPEAKFIHIVRDPRDVTLSWQKVPWEQGRRGYTFPARRWNASLSSMRRLARRHPSKLYEVRYEDLARDSRSTLKKIFEFLDLAPIEIDTAARKPVSVDVSRKPWHAQAGGAVSTSNVEKWRLELPESVQLAIDVIAHRGMRRYGYQPSEASLRRVGISHAVGLLSNELRSTALRTFEKLRTSKGFAARLSD